MSEHLDREIYTNLIVNGEISTSNLEWILIQLLNKIETLEEEVTKLKKDNWI